jgi:cell division protein FtsX
MIDKENQAPQAKDILDSIKEIWKRGNASHLDIEKDGKSVLRISLTLGTIGLILAPIAALIGIGAALITDYTVKITLDNGTVINVNDFAVNRQNSAQPDDAKDATPDNEQK